MVYSFSRQMYLMWKFFSILIELRMISQCKILIVMKMLAIDFSKVLVTILFCRISEHIIWMLISPPHTSCYSQGFAQYIWKAGWNFEDSSVFVGVMFLGWLSNAQAVDIIQKTRILSRLIFIHSHFTKPRIAPRILVIGEQFQGWFRCGYGT